jgi:hypothetical protein
MVIDKPSKFTFLRIATSDLVIFETAQRKVLGLVELPTVFGKIDPNGSPGLIRPSPLKAVAVYLHPSSNSPIIGQVSGWASIETKEFDYEAHAAVVYEIADGWVLIHLTESPKNEFGWLLHRSSKTGQLRWTVTLK